MGNLRQKYTDEEWDALEGIALKSNQRTEIFKMEIGEYKLREMLDSKTNEQVGFTIRNIIEKYDEDIKTIRNENR